MGKHRKRNNHARGFAQFSFIVTAVVATAYTLIPHWVS